MNALVQVNSFAGQCLASTRSYLSEVLNIGQTGVNAVSGAVRSLATRSGYIGEPCLEFASASLKSPVQRLTHPLATVRTLAGALETSASRAFKVISNSAGERTGKVKTLRPAPTRRGLQPQETAAYAERINATIDQALAAPHNKVTADKGLHDDLQQLPQVGPAMVRKLHAAGIYTFRQIASPDATDLQQLAQFSKSKAYPKWVAEARKRTA